MVLLELAIVLPLTVKLAIVAWLVDCKLVVRVVPTTCRSLDGAVVLIPMRLLLTAELVLIQPRHQMTYK